MSLVHKHGSRAPFSSDNSTKEKLRKYQSVEIALRGLNEERNQFLQERGTFDKKTEDISLLVIVLMKRLAEVSKSNFYCLPELNSIRLSAM